MVLQFLARGKQLNLAAFTEKAADDLPHVFIFMAVYNEELVIQQKLHSINQTNYPTHKMKLLIGSDGSTDQTHQIIKNFSKDDSIELYIFKGRLGKPQIINLLHEKYLSQIKEPNYDILILTDANVLFEPDTIFELVKFFKAKQTGIVGATIKNTNNVKSQISTSKKDQTSLNTQKGIGFLEKQYISRENQIKHYESVLFKKAMGVFGGCYALRAKWFQPVPAKFIVDDFYISLSILKKKYNIIQNLKALAYEDVPGKLKEEFRRKRRIGAGNMQNLHYFKNSWFPPFDATAFAFFSHKILRWFGPFCILFCWLSALVLAVNCRLFLLFFLVQTILVLIALLNYILKDTFALPAWIKFIGYFYAMNLALLLGFFDYLKGIETNVWEPTERNVG